MIAKLALEDGTVFTGTACGATGTSTGEVVFNTAMTGYQEIFTDPSYCGQIVTMTFPLQGNYGVNATDFESIRPRLSGVVLKELPRRPSNYRADRTLPEFLAAHGIVGLADIDTRALTRRIRSQGALRGVISTEIHDDLDLVRRASTAALMTGANLVDRIAPCESGRWVEPLWRRSEREALGLPEASAEPRCARPSCHIVVIDCGVKHNILRHLVENGARVTTVPYSASAARIHELQPDGLLVGNGPGDPAAVSDTIATLRKLIGRFPIFGICLGHQLLALALDAKTYKLSFGHHGANLPVLDRFTGRVEITSQNHGFAVDADSLVRVGGTVTHLNLNDGSLEGFVHEDKRLLAIQFHPEASPGPHDAGHLFERFVQRLTDASQPNGPRKERTEQERYTHG